MADFGPGAGAAPAVRAGLGAEALLLRELGAVPDERSRVPARRRRVPELELLVERAGRRAALVAARHERHADGDRRRERRGRRRLAPRSPVRRARHPPRASPTSAASTPSRASRLQAPVPQIVVGAAVRRLRSRLDGAGAAQPADAVLSAPAPRTSARRSPPASSTWRPPSRSPASSSGRARSPTPPSPTSSPSSWRSCRPTRAPRRRRRCSRATSRDAMAQGASASDALQVDLRGGLPRALRGLDRALKESPTMITRRQASLSTLFGTGYARPARARDRPARVVPARTRGARSPPTRRRRAAPGQGAVHHLQHLGLRRSDQRQRARDVRRSEDRAQRRPDDGADAADAARAEHHGGGARGPRCRRRCSIAPASGT